MSSLRAKVGSLEFENPSMVASGIMDETGLSMVRILRSGAGAAVSKSVGTNPNPGHANPNFIEVNGGCINAMGLPNPGIDAFAEEMEIAPSLNKQFARVYLEFQDADDGRVDYTLEVQGNVKGADKHTLQPVEGTFRCTPDESSDRGYEVRVPRQKDDSLMLRQFNEDGEELSPIPIGQIIMKAGFDWTRESLGDISILANIPEMSFLITILDWEGPITMTVTI